VPALVAQRADFREGMINVWQHPLDRALDQALISPQNTRRTAEALAGAFDEIVLQLLEQPDAQNEAGAAVADMTDFALRAVGFSGPY
jgi:hypothetical protein